MGLVEGGMDGGEVEGGGGEKAGCHEAAVGDCISSVITSVDRFAQRRGGHEPLPIHHSGRKSAS